MSAPTNEKTFKDDLYHQFGILGAALASPKRLELLDLLTQRERSVESLAGETGMSMSNVSQHLRVLRTARLVESRKEGQHIIYQIADPAVIAFWGAFRTLAINRLAEVRELLRVYLDNRDCLEPITGEEIRERLRKDEVILLDVRPEAEYRTAHLPGAFSIPLKDLDRRIQELPPDREIVAYCRGPFCVLSLEAVTLLRQRGRRARRLAEGVPEWLAHNLPLEVG